MTLPFFGSGIVELPPEGFKRAKNSRKMQMVFFVHEGKVLVTVGPPSAEQNGRGASGSETETNEFAISKGGVWVVPRGMFFFLPSFFLCSAPPPSTDPTQSLLARKPSRFIASPGTNRLKNSGQPSRPARTPTTSRPQKAVCATSRRNNLTIAPAHRTSCASSHRRLFARPGSSLREGGFL